MSNKTAMSTKTAEAEESPILTALHERFGLREFREGQAEVIEALLGGQSAAAIFPTGGGKSLCYQLPAILLDGLTLVVSPLLALMREQVDDLVSRGIPAARIDSTLSAEENREVLSGLRSGTIKLLYVAPERFFNERFRELISELDIALFAIDEAHCISQWGHNFRPDYLKLAGITKELAVPRVLALTATATPDVLEDIQSGFEIAPDCVVQTAFYRKNLTLRCTLCTDKERSELLVQRLTNSPPQPTLVYVSLQKTAVEVASQLAAHDLPCRAYHAGLPPEERAEIQDWFMKSDDAIVVATIAFGMGIDKSDIRAIYHYNSSKSIENLAQEIGRAGRDGKPAICETLLVPSDRIALDNFAYGDTPSHQALDTFVGVLTGQPESFFVSHYSLAYEADIRETVVRTLFTHLELSGLLQSTASRYECYQFQPKLRSHDILNHFEGERKVFASGVLALSVKKRSWFEVNLVHAAERLKCDRQRIVRMLDFFAEKGWVELKATGLRHGYRKLHPIENPPELVDSLYEFVQQRESSEVHRLDQLFELMTSQECLSQGLSSHFGQAIEGACGHCSVCEGNPIGELPQSPSRGIGDSAIKGLESLTEKQMQAIYDTRQKAKYLCGLSTPKLIRARLTRTPHYGCCSAVPFKDVLEAISDED
ncbi:MAG: ATP-dependent DNA helicase RecQ [Pirellulaceae bacterium]